MTWQKECTKHFVFYVSEKINVQSNILDWNKKIHHVCGFTISLAKQWYGIYPCD
jgi:hypothetical protein